MIMLLIGCTEERFPDIVIMLVKVSTVGCHRLPIDVFDVVVIDASVEDSTVDDDVMVELIEVGSLGVIGPADWGPGVKPG